MCQCVFGVMAIKYHSLTYSLTYSLTHFKTMIMEVEVQLVHIVVNKINNTTEVEEVCSTIAWP